VVAVEEVSIVEVGSHVGDVGNSGLISLKQGVRVQKLNHCAPEAVFLVMFDPSMNKL